MTALVEDMNRRRAASFDPSAGQQEHFNESLEEPYELNMQIGAGGEHKHLLVCPGGFEGELWVQIGEEGEPLPVSSEWIMDSKVVRADIGGVEASIQPLAKTTTGYRMVQHGTTYEVGVASGSAAHLLHHMPVPEVIDYSAYVVAPLSGTLRSVAVKPGDEIAAGAEVAVLETMKT